MKLTNVAIGQTQTGPEPQIRSVSDSGEGELQRRGDLRETLKDRQYCNEGEINENLKDTQGT